MKTIRILLSLLITLCLMPLAACSDKGKGNSAPVIEGAESFDCLERQSLDLFSGVRAMDREEGDISAKMTVTVDGKAVENGTVRFDAPGEHTAHFSVTDSSGKSAERDVPINIHERKVIKSIDLLSGFTLEDTAGAVTKSGLYNGAYVINATHKNGRIAFARAFEADKDVEYEIEYVLVSSVAGAAKIAVLNNDKTVNLQEGYNIISHKYVASSGSVTVKLDLSDMPDFEIKVESVRVKAVGDGFIEQVTNKLGLDDISASMSGSAIEDLDWGVSEDGNSGYFTVKVFETGERHIWDAKMYVHTGVELKKGHRYKVSFKAFAEKEQDFEITYNSQKEEKKASSDDDKKSEGAYGKRLYTGEPREYAYDKVIVPEGDRGELWIQLSLGAVPADQTTNTVTVSDISVKEEKGYVADFSQIAFTSKFAAEYGAQGNMKPEGNAIQYNVTSFSTIDWANELTSAPVALDNSGKKILVTFTASATKPVEAVFVMPPKYGIFDDRLVWSRIYLSEQEREYRLPFDNAIDSVLYSMLFQFGSVNNIDYHDVVITLSNFAFEEVSEYENF